MIPSINYHMWEPCNFRCKFCFATFQDVKRNLLPKGHLPENEAINLLNTIAQSGIKKINFAGGEPTLCPWLNKMLILSKHTFNIKTSIVTNGFELLKNDYALLKILAPHLDWIALSIDSLTDTTNVSSGRAYRGKIALPTDKYIGLANKVKELGVKLKINTVVHNLNYNEDMSLGVFSMKPERWKILQVLPVKDQNDLYIQDFEIGDKQFRSFVERHRHLEKEGICMVPETNGQIKGTYLMIDPAGRFFDDVKGTHTYSEPILKVGFETALKQIYLDIDGFQKRGGNYNY